MKTTYTISTALIIVWSGTVGLLALLGNAEIRETMTGLGYPAYFPTLLGVAKTAAAAALFLPVGRTLREWAYAGIIFETLASASSYAFSGAPWLDVVKALAIGLVVFISYLAWRRTHTPGPDEPFRNAFFKLSYRLSEPLWEIGRPQASLIEAETEGIVSGRVIDIGCGRGENANYLAKQGYRVLGVDLAAAAIKSARARAIKQETGAEFLTADLFTLPRRGEQYDTVIDYGVYHQFSRRKVSTYVETLSRLAHPGTTLLLQCFSDGKGRRVGKGPRHISEIELREVFCNGWRINWIKPTKYEVRSGAPFPAYLMKCTRLG